MGVNQTDVNTTLPYSVERIINVYCLDVMIVYHIEILSPKFSLVYYKFFCFSLDFRIFTEIRKYINICKY
jgi:hypothetical protein